MQCGMCPRVCDQFVLQKLTIDAPGRTLVGEEEVMLVERKWKRNKKVTGWHE